MNTYRALRTFTTESARHEMGAEFDLDDQAAAPLLQDGAIEPAQAPAVADPAAVPAAVPAPKDTRK